jgi:hypothetical protein
LPLLLAMPAVLLIWGAKVPSLASARRSGANLYSNDPRKVKQYYEEV